MAPAAAPTRMARSVAGMRWIPSSTLMYQATMAPKVTCSPWLKFTRPVVPKISDRPSEVMAMIRPKLRPSKSFCGICSSVLVVSRSRSPRVMFRTRLRFGSMAMTSPPSRGRPDVVVERVEVEGGRELALAGEGDDGPALLVGLDLVHLLVVGVGDDDHGALRRARRRPAPAVPLRSTTITEISRSSPAGLLGPGRRQARRGARPSRPPARRAAARGVGPASRGRTIHRAALPCGYRVVTRDRWRRAPHRAERPCRCRTARTPRTAQMPRRTASCTRPP